MESCGRQVGAARDAGLAADLRALPDDEPRPLQQTAAQLARHAQRQEPAQPVHHHQPWVQGVQFLIEDRLQRRGAIRQPRSPVEEVAGLVEQRHVERHDPGPRQPTARQQKIIVAFRAQIRRHVVAENLAVKSGDDPRILHVKHKPVPVAGRRLDVGRLPRARLKQADRRAFVVGDDRLGAAPGLRSGL